MTRDRALAAMVLLIAAAILVLVFSRHSSTKTVVHERTGPTLVAPAFTPLQVKRANRTSAARSPDSATPHRSGASTPSTPIAGSPKSPTRTGARKSPVTVKKRKTPARKPAAGSAPSAGSSAPPASPGKPLVTVTAPVPAGACVKGVGGLNC